MLSQPNATLSEYKELQCARQVQAILFHALALFSFSTNFAFAGLVDLTTRGAVDCSTVANACFQQIDTRPGGSGVIDSFVRISSNNAIEEGFNTSQRKVNYDENTSPTFTHSLTLGQVPIVSFNGHSYRQFMLDINQAASSPFLSLFRLEIFLRPFDAADAIAGNTPGKADFNGFNGPATLVFNLDATGDNYVRLNYALNSGSGSGDMFLYILSSLLSGSDSDYVVLYSAFGSPDANNAGFEEWGVERTAAPVPEPAAILLLATVFAAVGAAVLLRIRDLHPGKA